MTQAQPDRSRARSTPIPSPRGRRTRDFALRDLPLDGEGPLYDQIYRALRDAILLGRVGAGTRLPTTRALARELGVSRNTVVAAFEPLQAEGYVVSRVGAGTFVAPQLAEQTPPRTGGLRRVGGGQDSRPVARAAAAATDADDALAPSTPKSARLSRFGRAIAESDPRTIYDQVFVDSGVRFDFRPCVPDLDRLDYDDWRRQLVRAANYTPASELDYADPAGLPELRAEIAAYLGRARGVLCEADDVIVVGGVAQALDLSARLFVDPGDAVMIEDPHYLGARRCFEMAGAEIVGAPVDEHGVDPGRVDPAARSRCRLAYVTPSHQYPTGVILSLARRQALLAWADEANAYVVEDDYDSEFRYAGRAIPSLKSLDEHDRVIYVGTFSKTLLPSLRMAYLVVPPSLRGFYRTAKWLSDWAAPTFEQIALARSLASGDFERHLRRARTLYARSREALVEAIDAELAPFGATYHDSRAGLHLLVRLARVPAPRLRDVLRAAAHRGLRLYPVSPSHLHPERLDAVELVMGFGRLEPEAIASGIRLLHEALCEVVGVVGEGAPDPAGRAALAF